MLLKASTAGTAPEVVVGICIPRMIQRLEALTVQDMSRLFAGTPFDIPPHCDRCGKPEAECSCPAPLPASIPPEKQTAKVRVDRRKHKRLVTIVWGLSVDGNDLPQLLSQLKSACGSGGSLQGDQIELQGDHVDRVREQLRQIGYKVR